VRLGQRQLIIVPAAAYDAARQRWATITDNAADLDAPWDEVGTDRDTTHYSLSAVCSVDWDLTPLTSLSGAEAVRLTRPDSGRLIRERTRQEELDARDLRARETDDRDLTTPDDGRGR
jgi:hypothetical protein